MEDLKDFKLDIADSDLLCDEVICPQLIRQNAYSVSDERQYSVPLIEWRNWLGNWSPYRFDGKVTKDFYVFLPIRNAGSDVIPHLHNKAVFQIFWQYFSPSAPGYLEWYITGYQSDLWNSYMQLFRRFRIESMSFEVDFIGSNSNSPLYSALYPASVATQTSGEAWTLSSVTVVDMV